MNSSRGPLILAAALLLVLTGLARPGLAYRRPAPQAEAAAQNGYLTGAFYYTWFPSNFDYGWLRNRLVSRQPAMLGLYDSRDPEVCRRHIAWASRYGIDFLALDWWPNRPEQNSVISDVFLQSENIDDIKFCIFYETWALGQDGPSQSSRLDQSRADKLTADILKIADSFFNHPSYLKIKGRPVIIFYLTRTLSGQVEAAFQNLRAKLLAKGFDPYFIGDEVFWEVSLIDSEGASKQPQERRIKLFDAVTSYNMYESRYARHAGYGADTDFMRDVAELYDTYLAVCGEQVDFVPNVFPGFNDRGTRYIEDHYVIPRQWSAGDDEGSFFSQYIARIGIPYLDPDLNMLLVTSFNEWNEDTAIEPLDVVPSTSRDDSESGTLFTQGYAYAGYGYAYLEVLRNMMCAVHGRVTDGRGRPVWKARVCAWGDGLLKTCDLSDQDGRYTLSRLGLGGGDYLIGLADRTYRIPVNLQPGRASRRVDISTQN